MASLCVRGANSSTACSQTVFHVTDMVMDLKCPSTGMSISPARPMPVTDSVMNSKLGNSTLPAPRSSLPSL